MPYDSHVSSRTLSWFKNYVPLRQISQYLQKTIILTEDSNFWNHKGFDWESIEKNARDGLASGVFKRGGSTISQQLAKNLFLSKDRTFIRKGLEAVITDRIEHTLTKKEILERYLNVVEFGKNIYGVKAAAKYYFQKSPAELSVVESAFLAMVLPNPIKYSQSYYRKELTPFAKSASVTSSKICIAITAFPKKNIPLPSTKWDISLNRPYS